MCATAAFRLLYHYLPQQFCMSPQSLLFKYCVGISTQQDLHMAWALTATWEWISVGRDEADDLVWKECSPASCASLQEAIDGPDPVGKKVSFKQGGITRDFKVVRVDENRMEIHHGFAEFIVRPIVRKLLHSKHENDQIVLTGMVSGAVALELPFESYAKEPWGSFTRFVEEELNLRPGRAIVFPPGYDSAEAIEEWKLRPHNRVWVQNLLKAVDGPNRYEWNFQYVRKRPASSLEA